MITSHSRNIFGLPSQTVASQVVRQMTRHVEFEKFVMKSALSVRKLHSCLMSTISENRLQTSFFSQSVARQIAQKITPDFFRNEMISKKYFSDIFKTCDNLRPCKKQVRILNLARAARA